MSALVAPVWRVARLGPVTTDLIEHAVRGHAYTLCGRTLDRITWVAGGTPIKRCRHCAAVPDGHAIALDFIAAGITYRQIDYWTNQGLVHSANGSPGHGFRRSWPASELQVACAILELLGKGRTLPTAAREARTAQEACAALEVHS